MDEPPTNNDPFDSGFGALSPIPVLFHSLELDGPFTQCMNCNASIRVEDAPPYMIERVFRGTEPILEYAMCLQCRGQMGGGISELSMQRLTAFFEERIDFAARSERLLSRFYEDDGSIEAWFDHCAITRRHRNECDSFQVIALCQEQHLVLGPLPLMISDVAAEEMQRLMSPETKGWMDDFVSDNFGMPSEFCEPPVPFLI